MKLLYLNFFTTILCCFLLQPNAFGQQLDNTGETSAGDLAIKLANFRAITFVAGTTISNENITVQLVMNDASGTPGGDFTVQIWGDNSGEPNHSDVIATLSGNVDPATAGTYSYTGTASWTATQTYYIVMSSPNTTGLNAYEADYTSSSTITTSNGYTANYVCKLSINSGNGFWFDNTGRHKFSLSVASLPVELIFFKGQASNAAISLNWQTATEKNNKGFEIETSTNGQEWQNIGFVTGHGTTTELQDYEFVDEAPSVGTNYYRLKQIDYDGKFEYSDVVTVNYSLEVNNEAVKLFPNPVTDELNIVNGQGIATIYNILGQPIKQFSINNQQLTIDTADLPKGQYILHIQSRQVGRNIITRYFVK